MAVAASPKLWIVSASKATLPEISTTPTCNRAVIISTMNDHFRAHNPSAVVRYLRINNAVNMPVTDFVIDVACDGDDQTSPCRDDDVTWDVTPKSAAQEKPQPQRNNRNRTNQFQRLSDAFASNGSQGQKMKKAVSKHDCADRKSSNCCNHS